MSVDRLEQDEIVSLLSHRPNYLSDAMITITSLPKRNDDLRGREMSSLGLLDMLPPEIILMTLNILDFQSLSRMSRVSWRGRSLVESLPAYRDILNTAPATLVALRDTKLIALHSAVRLHTALRSDRCVCCSHYGAFLFLPACYRACWQCLNVSARLRVISEREAKKYFCLAPRSVNRLLSFKSIPGNYGIAETVSISIRSLFSAAMAGDLSVEVHGSVENMARKRLPRLKSGWAIATGGFLQAASETHMVDTLALPNPGHIPPNHFFGMASMAFPSMSPSGIVEHGIWCQGCELVEDLYRSGRLDFEAISRVIPKGCEPKRILLGLARRAWSQADFVDHVKHCHGARLLLASRAPERP